MRTEVISNENFRSEFHEEKQVISLISSITQELNAVDTSFSRGANSSSALKWAIGQFLGDWNRDLLIQQDFPSRRFPSSHVQVDFQKELLLPESNRKVQVTLEIFGDNRQAVAANLLKLELAGRNYAKFGVAIGIGVCVDKELKKLGWDGSTATSDEYEFALLHTYSRFIETPIILVAVA